jgi:hypothetical protein
MNRMVTDILKEALQKLEFLQSKYTEKFLNLIATFQNCLNQIKDSPFINQLS